MPPSGKSLPEKFPEIAAMWHPTLNEGTSASDVGYGSAVKRWWQCSDDPRHIFHTSPNNLTSSKAKKKCSVCNGKVVVAGVNDLATEKPASAAVWDHDRNDFGPTEVVTGSNKRAHWVCPKGHRWVNSINNQTKKPDDRQCAVCGGRRVAKDFNDLLSLRPDLAAEWGTENEGSPDQYGLGSNYRAHWSCHTCGNSWYTTIVDRANKGYGCPVCAGKRVNPGSTDIATVAPHVAATLHPDNGVDPSQVSAGSPKKYHWRCTYGHEWWAAPAARVRGNGCPVCANRVVVPGVNDLETIFPEIAAEWHPTLNGGLSARDVVGKSGRLVWWQCGAGHEWEAIVNSRTGGGNGCRRCTSFVSKSEAELTEAIRALLPEATIETGLRGLLGDGREVDVYLPEHGFAVEFNGVYWHSEAVGRTKHYHADKARLAREQGIQLFMVWEDDWATRRDVVVRALAHRLGATDRLRVAQPDIPAYMAERIGARSLRPAEVSGARMREFLDANHIQGATDGSRYLALIDTAGNIRAGMVVSNRGRSAPGTWEIARYATAGTVAGGFTRLLATGQRLLGRSLSKWVTFADLSVSDGGLYEANGFTVDKAIPPDYTYLVAGRRQHKFGYRLKRFETDPNLIWAEGKSERELAELNGLWRIWDCGKIRYVRDV